MCLGHRHLFGDSNERGDRLKSMVGSDLQQCRFGSLEFRHDVYGPVDASFCSYPGLTYWDDQYSHTHLYLERGLDCNVVSLIRE